MHRWFFANEELICKKPRPPTPPQSTTPERPPSPEPSPDILWKFTVEFKEKLCSNESVAICGSIEALGKWSVSRCVPLVKDKDSPTLWAIELPLPRGQTILYRYLVCAVANGHCQKIVRFWECQKEARLIKTNVEQNLELMEHETFGLTNELRGVQRGWITENATALQLKFYKAPFVLRAARACPLLYIKITPMRITAPENFEKKENIAEEENSKESKSNFGFCEVGTLQEHDGEFHYQPKYGTACGSEQILIFHLTLGDFENTAYLIDLFSYPAKAASDIPPYHFGYLHVYPQQLKKSDGTLKLNIMCATTHRPIGVITCDYLVVKHLDGHTFKLSDPLQIPTKAKGRKILDIGHRGCGPSFWFHDNILRENTVNSFNKAWEHGADMVEFDVQLSKDKIPIVYHDFQLYISRKANFPKEEYDIFQLSLYKNEINYLKTQGRIQKSGLITLPLSQFTLAQLKRVQVYEIPDESSPPSNPCREDSNINPPFATLEHVLRKLPQTLGFFIEVKYPQQLSNGQWKDNFAPDCDKNEYVDIILDTVLKHAQSRHIIFSSFDADVCTMIRLKQNRFPVTFVCHANAHQPKFLDPRGDSILHGLFFASAMELYGIAGDSHDVRMLGGRISYVHDHNLCLFAWGLETRQEQYRKQIWGIGVDGIIFDRINHVLQPEDLKHNIVLIELREVDGGSIQQEANVCE